MCGIFAYINNGFIEKSQLTKLNRAGIKCKERGPDNTITKQVDNIFLMFHRLKINDVSSAGDQPLIHPEDPDIILICNGEIYNWKQLAIEHNCSIKSTSDCEIIVHLYKKYGIDHTIKILDGVFAFVLIDKSKKLVYAGRDPIGVRSMYVGVNKQLYSNIYPPSYGFASECKNLDTLFASVHPFPPGSYTKIQYDQIKKQLTPLTVDFISYYNYIYPPVCDTNETDIMKTINDKLYNSIQKRLLSDRPIGCLLSGGLDSSLITALVNKFHSKQKLITFSIGLEGAEDLKYANIVAQYLQTDHREYIVTAEQMLQAIPTVIEKIETYDVTTIRASTPMYLLSKYIKDTTDITVLFSGEGSDEASGSYMYFHNAPNQTEFQKEIIRLMKDLHYFDVLRCDKSTASAGLEVRVPFLDKEFLQYYLGIDPAFKIPQKNRIEKHLLRKSFDNGLLPDSVLWRAKEGMSDGVSSKEKGWYEIIQDYVDTLITDTEFKECSSLYSHNPPKSKEALYYRKIYDKLLHGRSTNIPYYWLPKWCGENVEPSARVLKVYNRDESTKQSETISHNSS
jgi:asparagine synthase (glutamine-hydrolysing)